MSEKTYAEQMETALLETTEKLSTQNTELVMLRSAIIHLNQVVRTTTGSSTDLARLKIASEAMVTYAREAKNVSSMMPRMEVDPDQIEMNLFSSRKEDGK